MVGPMTAAAWRVVGHWHRDPWMRVAQVAGCVVLLVAPFRSSAGLRGLMLLVAAAALLIAHSRARQFSLLWPRATLLGATLLVWIIAATASALTTPLMGDALGVVKRDILAPVLAGLVFFALTRTRRDLLRWCWVLTVGLLALTVMVVREPFDPTSLAQNPAYLNVGWLTTWLVTLAPLLSVLLLAPHARRRESRVLLGIGIACICIASWMSGSRMIWVCFAAMLALGMAVNLPRLEAQVQRRHALAFGGLLLAVLLLMLLLTMQFRASTQSPQTDAITFALQDHRNLIWREALAMIAERPWSGFGYGNEAIGDLFSARFTEPWFRAFVRQPHNVLLNQALQMGLMGAALLAAMFTALAGTFVRVLRGHRFSALARWSASCGLALVAGVLLRNTVDDFFTRHGVLFFGIACGALLGLATRRSPLKSPQRLTATNQERV
jgi:O-antigen ligase